MAHAATHDTLKLSFLQSLYSLDSLITSTFRFHLITVTVIPTQSRHRISHACRAQRRRHVQWSIAIGRCLDEYEFDRCDLHVLGRRSVLEIARLLHSGECHQVPSTPTGGSGTSRGDGRTRAITIPRTWRQWWWPRTWTWTRRWRKI
jgi:hypothetical protein